MSDEYANYAFISYSHKDEKWAAWIQRKLEAYRLPSVIRKEAGSTVPERIRPVFRDATDLGAGRLRNNLQSELESSRFLIVVCSPNSAQPNAEGKHWVNDEVTHFASLGRADRIVPVLIEGDEKTAFCPKLRELGILAVDATKKSRARTLNDIVAALLGLRPDQLWLREERIRRRKRLWRGLVATASLVLAALGCLRWYDLAATHVQYYSDYVDEWGIPTGIPSQLLTKEQVRNRLFSYRFEFCGREKGGLLAPRILRRVVMQDADGQVLDMEDAAFFKEDDYYLKRPRIQILRYTDDGELESIEDRDCKNFQLVRHKFSGKGNCDVEHVHTVGGREFDALLPVYGGEFRYAGDDAEKSRILRYSYVRDESGRIIKTIYKSSREDEVRNFDGVSGVAYVRDKAGRPIREILLSNNRLPFIGNNGVLGFLRCFSEEGFLSRSRFVDAVGNSRADSESGFAESRYERDRFGNAVKIEFLDETGMPAMPKDGTAFVEQTIESGRLALKKELNAQHDPVSTMELVWLFPREWLKIRMFEGKQTDRPLFESHRHFKDGNCVGMEWSRDDGFQSENKDEPVGFRAEWKDNREVKRVYFGPDRKPMSFRPSYPSFSAEYDENGLQTEWFFLGENERPVNGPDGWSGTLNEYENGKPRHTRLVDEHRRPVMSKSLGAAGSDFVFKGGNMVEMTYVGTNGLPVLGAEGFAKLTRKYENGNLLSWRFLGLDNELVAGKDGKAGADFRYDEEGRRTEHTWIGSDGKPVIDERAGAAGFRSKFDAAGNEIEFFWIGLDGKPCRSAHGSVGWRAEYNQAGQLVKQTWLGIDGKPETNKVVATATDEELCPMSDELVQ